MNTTKTRSSNTNHNTSTAEAQPSLRVDTNRFGSHTTSSAMSEGTFYSVLGSALLDHVNPTSGEEPSRPDGGVNMGRTDSGFAENASLADESSARGAPDDTVSVKTFRQRHEVSQNDPLRKPKKRSSRSTVDNQHKSTPSTRSKSRDHGKSKTPSSSRASSNHRPTTRRNSSSMTAASTRTSRPSSKRSARSSYSRPPMVPLRNSSSTLPHRHAHNPFALHYKSCQLFQSIGSTIAYQDITAASANGDSMAGNSIPPRHPVTRDSPDLELDEDFDPQPVPRATIIDWTSPSTRRREYARIDKNSKGLRGWWRRNAPGWCFKGCRAGFYDAERDSDAGSVRRYRLDLPDQDDDAINLVDEKSGGDKVKARSMGRRRWLGRTWSGFSGKRACKGEDCEASRKTW
ncbi:MAG: hypothetical protein M1836_000245 [Candelina mexicana]|nr:MAG: hypothetical protein M1836_000245 [Candelina mexicana]